VRCTIKIVRITCTLISFRYLFALVFLTKTLRGTIFTVTSSSFRFWRLLTTVFTIYPFGMHSRYTLIYDKKSALKLLHSSKVFVVELTGFLKGTEHRFRSYTEHISIHFFTGTIAIGCILFCNFTTV
jgi:hypothetical protein